MKKQLTHVSPVRAGFVLGSLYGIFGLLAVPFMWFFMTMSEKYQSTSHQFSAGAGFAMVIFLPIFYAIFGFIGGIISAAVYNLVASFTGGLEFETKDA
jgi:hypothetical protein